MAISQIIKFEGSPDDLVWKYSGEEFNATSQLIVDETHQAVLVVNGQAADLFGPGRHTLTVPNIPLVKKIINIPTGGESPFPCKVFYISQVHQMDMLWGSRGAITLDDPLYDIFLHVMLHGSLTFSIADTRKFLVKLVGFRSRYTAEEMINNFKGLVSAHVKDCISKIMINGMLSYFMINAHLFEISESVKERLDTIFDEYGIRIEYFNIETIEVPKEDYDAVTKAKERRSGRLIEGYTWQEERQMMIAEKFAGNEGTMGGIGGAVGGFMMGGAMGGSIVDIAKSALDPNNIPKTKTSGNVAGQGKASDLVSGGKTSGISGGFDVGGFLNGGNSSSAPSPSQTPASGGTVCKCGAQLQPGAKFCMECGEKVQSGPVCAKCGSPLQPGAKFCMECGEKVQASPSNCPSCGEPLQPGAKFCMECGHKL
ncbi:MAG: SPFH domain-containing protein [Ruminococcus sp.]|nr:SPFH domain-containing protein [Ruminococcus sp.]